MTCSAKRSSRGTYRYLNFSLIFFNQYQDVACIRCNEVRVRDISSLCECSGKFACMESGDEYQSFIRTVRSLADYYKMDVLKSTLDWMLGTVGTRRTPVIKIDKKVIL